MSFGPEMESTLQEERSLKLQVEGKMLQLEKDHSMLDCDYKQVQQRLDELQAQKEKLSEEVCLCLCERKGHFPVVSASHSVLVCDLE